MAPVPALFHSRPWVLILLGICVLVCIITASMVLVLPQVSPDAADGTCPTGPATEPVFTDPAKKLEELKDRNFSKKLFDEAATYEPLLAARGTQVHMCFWSGKDNHGNALRLLDVVNGGSPASASPPHRAIWNEGVNAFYPYPAWVTILNEHWYDRGTGINGTVTIFGKTYQDPYPITPDDADEIVGEYSARYAGMAEYIARATGKPVNVWCFVHGAKPGRVFSRYEEPELKRLEADGFAVIYYAKSLESRWDNAGDWISGTENSPLPLSGL